jgi:hypothetical protein
MQVSKETLYAPKKLEELRADISEKLKKKSRFSFFRKIKKFILMSHLYWGFLEFRCTIFLSVRPVFRY